MCYRSIISPNPYIQVGISSILTSEFSHADEAATELVGEDTEQWQSSRQRILDLGFDDEEAEKILRKAFGWASQGYWRKSKVKEVPSVGQVSPRLLLVACIFSRPS
jgi:hypothetical protein